MKYSSLFLFSSSKIDFLSQMFVKVGWYSMMVANKMYEIEICFWKGYFSYPLISRLFHNELISNYCCINYNNLICLMKQINLIQWLKYSSSMTICVYHYRRILSVSRKCSNLIKWNFWEILNVHWWNIIIPIYESVCRLNFVIIRLPKQ
jgi:hypothetical protein